MTDSDAIRQRTATENKLKARAEVGVTQVSTAARALVDSVDVIDLHLDLEVPVRLYGYDATMRHTPGWRRFFGHTDWPRLREAGFTGAVYDIATNPFRPAANRQQTTIDNLASVSRRAAASADVAVVRTVADYRAARSARKLCLWPALQGGNALAHDPSVLDGEVGDLLHRITLVHLTRSVLGGTSSPIFHDPGLTDAGRDFVARCNRRRILVDLAHAGKRTFWDALAAHDPALPPIVSHTGVDGVHPHWRNLDDDQIRAIADRGGVIGIIFQSSFLEALSSPIAGGRRARILDHLEHVIHVVGDTVAAIGTDYDGAIVPPADLPDVTDFPLLVQDMLDRGWSEERITRVLGANYLRVAAAVRPD
jgi:membrane dipeptidase